MNILVPLAAFAVSLTGAATISPDLLRQAGLTETQIAAFEEARDLRLAGDHEAARDVLMDANIDEDVMEQLRKTMKEYRAEHNIAIREAIEEEDYESFRTAVAGSPLGEIIDSKAEFERFVEAHNLMKSGDREEAREILEELGLLRDDHRFGPFVDKLSDEEREELREAIEDRDMEKVREILKDAGIEPKKKMMEWRERNDRN